MNKYVEYFEYLDELRESGVTNMWGSPAYLTAQFDLPKRDAVSIVGQWMDTYSMGTSAEDRAEKALQGAVY
jgi:hypothetical protein